MDNLEKLLRITLLYDKYKNLLTEKQKMYFEEYYFSNLSIGEVASKYGVSRNAVYSQLTLLITELEEYEAKLCLLKKSEDIKEIIEKLKSSATEEQLVLLEGLEEVNE